MSAEPPRGFSHSRRLTGPSRYFAGPAVTLTPLGTAAGEPRALAEWAREVCAMAAALGWPAPSPVIEHHPGETLLLFAAPVDALLTATEVSEWAWERAGEIGAQSEFALAQTLGDDPVAEFAARARAERDEALIALRTAATAHDLPLFEDDEEVSLGAGTGSRRWRRDALPSIDAVPWDDLHDIPTALVTGSNGKTTTTRLVAAMAVAARLTPGVCSTEGVVVGGRVIAEGDYSGPDGARSVLRDAHVQLAVLETARGGILRRGLAVRRAEVAVVLNVRADHVGEYGIVDIDDLADTKLTVARTVQCGGTLVLNADDAVLMAAAARLPHALTARRALFAADYDHPALDALRATDGATCGVRDGRLLANYEGRDETLGDVLQLPLTLAGAAPYNLANLAAAALVGIALGLPLAAVGGTLRSFGALPLDNPGRLERWPHQGVTVLIDYAHNPDALDQLLRTARALRPARLWVLLGQAGNRDDAAIADLARTAARFEPDGVIVKELPSMLRGRALGEVPALLEAVLLAAGLPRDRIRIESDEETAARLLIGAAGPGDVVVLPVHTRDVRERLRTFLR